MLALALAPPQTFPVEMAKACGMSVQRPLSPNALDVQIAPFSLLSYYQPAMHLEQELAQYIPSEKRP